MLLSKYFKFYLNNKKRCNKNSTYKNLNLNVKIQTTYTT